MMSDPIFNNDAIVLGILMGILGFVFITSNSKNSFWIKFYKYVPALLLCYFIPSIFNSLGVISGDSSKLYFVASRYLLPTSLALLTPLGEVQRLVRGDVDLPLDGGPGNMRAIYSTWENGKMVAKVGDCFVQIVEWDPEGNVKSESILFTFGILQRVL